MPVSPLIMTFAARQAGIPYGEYCLHGDLMARAQLECIRRFGYDSVNVTSDAVRESETVGAPVFWQEDDVPAGADEPFIAGQDDLKKLHLPDPLGQNRMHEQIKALQILQHDLGEGEVVYGWVEAPFQEASMLRNINYLMTDIYTDPDLVHKLMRFATDMELEFGLAQIEAGARFIGVGDAIATLISPQHYREFNLPYVIELIAELKKAGARVKYHACGNTKRLLPLFSEIGADILNLDSLVDLTEVKQLLGDKVCIKGNLDPVRVFLEGTPETVEQACQQAIRQAGMGGRYILSPGCEVPRDTPPENLAALVEAAKKHGAYQIEGNSQQQIN